MKRLGTLVASLAVLVAYACAPAPEPGPVAEPAAGEPAVEAVEQTAPDAPPIVNVAIETEKGTIEIEFFRSDAPKSVDYITGLVNKGFYRAQRFYQVGTGFVRFGDQTTRDMTKMKTWGTAPSTSPIGVAEWNDHKHVRGSVALSHFGDPATVDSRLYIMKAANPKLDETYVVIGQVTEGLDVVDSLEKSDVLKDVTIKEAAAEE